MTTPRIEIHSGTVTGCTVTDAKGTRPVLVPVHRRFYVDVVEADGTSIGMWDGTSYDEAIRCADELAKDFGGTLVDLVVSGGDESKGGRA
jgi:hypothetical protein